LALVLLTGCGTFQNLKEPPKGPTDYCTGRCYPFGGVMRSGCTALIGPSFGLGEVIEGSSAISHGEFGPGFEHIGSGMILTAAGLGAIVDTPLSLAGDILTFPIAYARSKEYPWATWWGEKSTLNPERLPTTIPEEGNVERNKGDADIFHE